MIDAPILARPRRVVIGRLLWQTWRQSRWMMVILAGPGTVTAILRECPPLSLSQSSRPRTSLHPRSPPPPSS